MPNSNTMHALAAHRPMSGCPLGIVPIHWPVGSDGVDDHLSEIHRLGFSGMPLGDSFPRGEALADLLARYDLRRRRGVCVVDLHNAVF